MGSAGRNYVEAHFNRGKLAGKMLAVMEGLSGDSTGMAPG